MIERGQASLMDMQVMENARVVNWTESDTAEVFEQVINCDSTGGAFTVTLPDVCAAMGKAYSIKLITDNGDVTVQDQDDSYSWEGDYTLGDAGDALLLFSDGHKWYAIANYGV